MCTCESAYYQLTAPELTAALGLSVGRHAPEVRHGDAASPSRNHRQLAQGPCEGPEHVAGTIILVSLTGDFVVGSRECVRVRFLVLRTR